jgi:PhnB protein
MAATLNPYLIFNDKTEEAFNLYKSVFGGDFQMVMRFKDVPPEHQMSTDHAEKIMHIALPVGEGMLMGSDSPDDGPEKAIVGNNVQISISAASEKEADAFFKGLSAGGKAIMPMAKAFWGDYFGMLIDKFGVHWMISYAYNKK